MFHHSCGGRPAGGDLVVVAEIGHELGVLVHDGVVRPDTGEVDALGGVAYGKVFGGLDRIDRAFAVGKVLDKGLRSVDLGGVAVIEHAEAPDAALQLALAGLGGEAHENDLLAVVGELGIVVVGVELLSDVPAERHLEDALTESGESLRPPFSAALK